MTSASFFDIFEQADSLAGSVERAGAADLGAALSRPQVVFTGCGASFHAAAAAAGFWSALGRGPAQALPASDLWMNADVWLPPGATVVGLSRTGTTIETVAALQTARDRGAVTLGVSLAEGSPVLVESDHGIALAHVGERGRVMTRSFTNMLLAAQVFALRAALEGAGSRRPTVEAYLEATAEVPGAVATGVHGWDEAAQALARSAPDHVVFLGSGPDVALGRQAALQLQETARVAVEAHAVLDYRHGPLAALTPRSLVVVLSTARSLPADLLVADDLATLGGTMVAVGPAAVVARFPEHVHAVPVPEVAPQWLQSVVTLPFLQLLAYHLTVARHADPESVRNLDRTKTPFVDPHVVPTDLFSAVPGHGGA